ncbi:MAG: hypothetical protein Roseis2KO_55670 [Roseivirga sp.]
MNGDMIFKLILRDLRVYRWSFLLLSAIMLIIGMLTIFVNTNTVGMFTSSGSSIAMVAMAAYMSELKTKSAWMHTLSLPVTRKDMVTARFLSTLLVSAINLAIWLLAFCLLAGMIKPGADALIGPIEILYTWVHILFRIALYFFVFYRFNIIVIVSVYLLPTVLYAIFSPKATPMSDLVLDDANLFLIWILGSIVLLVASYFSALSYLKKKDL